MRSLTRAAFWFLVVGTLFMFLGWVLPFWFARGTSTENGVYWNIFYGVSDINNVRNTRSTILKKANVFGTLLDTDIKLEAISILAIVAFVFCFVSLVFGVIFTCALCGHKTSYFYLILGTTLSTTTSGILALITIILAGIALEDFFKTLDIQNGFEFPWSVLFYGIATLLLLISAFLYFNILNRWKVYRHIYSKDRYYFEQPDVPFFTHESKPDYDRKGNFFRNDSFRKSYPPRDYPREDIKRIDYYHDYPRRDFYDDYRKPRPIDSYDRKFAREYRKPAYYYDRYRDDRRYVPYYYNGHTRYDRPWHSKVDEVMDEANRLRTSFKRGRDRYYY